MIENLKQILVSIVIPVYNAEATLEECVISVVEQNESNIEIILVDDGSTDNSAKICDKLQLQNEEIIRVFHKKNQGSMWARVNGTQEAKGKYILFLDADDLIEKDAIKRIKKIIDTAVGDVYLFDLCNDIPATKTRHNLFKERMAYTFDIANKGIIYRLYMMGILNSLHTTVLNRTLILGTIQNLPQNKMSLGEDRYHKLLLLLDAQKVIYIPETFYYCRTFANSQSSDARNCNMTVSMISDMTQYWSLDRMYYSDMGFSENECTQYDMKALQKLISIFDFYASGSILKCGNKIKELIKAIEKNEWFCIVSDNPLINDERLHFKIIIKLFKAKMANTLIIYLKLCARIRMIRYGNPQGV